MAGFRTPVDRVVLTLPMPPSANRLWRVGRGRKGQGKAHVYPSPKYAAWKKEAGWSLTTQRPGQVKGSYKITIKLAGNETRIDLANSEKCVSDLLQSHGVIENDNLAQSITLLWGAAEGCIVTVEAFDVIAEAA